MSDGDETNDGTERTSDGDETNDGVDGASDDVDGATPDDSTELDELFDTIEQRKRDLPDDSYTASLFTHEKGIDGVLEKLGEESTELTLAAKGGDDEAVRHESADLVYHLLVLLAMRDLTLDDLRAELRERFG